MNSFIWVSRRTLLGGAHYSAVATLPVAKNQLVSDIHGQLSVGGGFADSYYLPLILGWNKERASIRALAGILAPTGRFREGASDNVGSGYWTPTLSSSGRAQAVSAPQPRRSPRRRRRLPQPPPRRQRAGPRHRGRDGARPRRDGGAHQRSDGSRRCVLGFSESMEH